MTPILRPACVCRSLRLKPARHSTKPKAKRQPRCSRSPRDRAGRGFGRSRDRRDPEPYHAISHVEISLRALERGKHVYSAKPFVTDLQDGRQILELARQRGRLVGNTPDMFLGGRIQPARRALHTRPRSGCMARPSLAVSYGCAIVRVLAGPINTAGPGELTSMSLRTRMDVTAKAGVWAFLIWFMRSKIGARPTPAATRPAQRLHRPTVWMPLLSQRRTTCILQRPRCFGRLELQFFATKPWPVRCEKLMLSSILSLKPVMFFGVDSMMSCFPIVQQACELVASGALGKINQTHVEFLQDWMVPDDVAAAPYVKWRLDPSQSGLTSCTGDIGTRAAHLAQMVSGLRLAEVRAEMHVCDAPKALEDIVLTMTQFDGDVPGTLLARA